MRSSSVPVRDVDVRIAQQRRQIVGVGPHPRVLKVDDVQAAIAQHEVAAVIVAMAQHARLGRELFDDRLPFRGERGSLGFAQCRAAIPFDEVLDEVLELPRELLDIERHTVGQVLIGLQLGAAALQPIDQRDGLQVERRVLRERCGAQMSLERDVAEILQHYDAKRIGVAEDLGDRERHLTEQVRDVRERQGREIDGTGVQGDHVRGCVRRNHAEVLAIGRVAGERHDARAAVDHPGLPQKAVNPFPGLETVGSALVCHVFVGADPCVRPGPTRGSAPPSNGTSLSSPSRCIRIVPR